MSYALEAAIHLTIADNSAYTVLVELRRLGYPELERVDRIELLRLTLGDTASAPEDVVAALERAEVVYNPNKHRLSYFVEGNVAGPATRVPGASEAAEFEAVTADRDEDNTRLARLLKDHFGIADLQSLSRAVAWSLYDNNGPASRERLLWACDRLLCNPLSQLLEIRYKPARIAVRELKPQAANQSG